MTVKRVALFVEGSKSHQHQHGRFDPLDAIWNELLCNATGVKSFDFVFPITKGLLVAMDPSNPKMPGNAEPFDERLARMLKLHEFDAAVVAWDLVPKWNPEAAFCRRQETLDLYRFLSQSKSEALPNHWKVEAEARLVELNSRVNDQKHKVPKLKQGMTLALCMEPMFEVVLTPHEAALKEAFGCKSTPKNWPQRGWGDPHLREPDKKLLAPAVDAVLAVRPKLPCTKHIRGDFEKKNDWGEYLLRRLLADERVRPLILGTPFVERLGAIRR